MKKKIMVIDDEPFISMMIEDKFKEKFEVISIRDSSFALNAIRKERPDLIILDWMMPRISGLDILKAIKAEPELKDIPVFMLTAKGQEDDELAGIRYGAERYITKPFSPRQLLELVIERIERT
ncbi:MAG: response regulator [Thermodesulfovibrionales bacterium]